MHGSQGLIACSWDKAPPNDTQWKVGEIVWTKYSPNRDWLTWDVGGKCAICPRKTHVGDAEDVPQQELCKLVRRHLHVQHKVPLWLSPAFEAGCDTGQRAFAGHFIGIRTNPSAVSRSDASVPGIAMPIWLHVFPQLLSSVCRSQTPSTTFFLPSAMVYASEWFLYSMVLLVLHAICTCWILASATHMSKKSNILLTCIYIHCIYVCKWINSPCVIHLRYRKCTIITKHAKSIQLA